MWKREKKVKNYCWWKKWLKNKVVFVRYNRVWINGTSVLSVPEKNGITLNKKKERKVSG